MVGGDYVLIYNAVIVYFCKSNLRGLCLTYNDSSVYQTATSVQIVVCIES